MPRKPLVPKRAASLFLFLVLLFTATAPAAACMADPLPEAVIFDRPPAKHPPGYILLKVVAQRIDREGSILVKLTDPAQAKQLGAVAWLVPETLSSCTDPGRLGSKAFVVARPDGRIARRTKLTAKVYRRSRWDSFWGWFGLTRYTASGDPVDNSRWR